MATFPTPISPRAAILQKRHITNEQADILNVGPMALDDVISHLGYRPKGSIHYIEALPYWDVDGHPLGEPDQFFRFRINYTPGWEPPDGDWKEYPKYRSPRRKGEHVYLPRGVGIDWVAVYGEPQIPVIITEGEYKAIRACSAWDKPCLGLGGVWMFHANKPGWPAGMDMNFTGRECFIVYDADQESTQEHPLKGGISGPDGAAKRLANKLYWADALPSLLYIARTETFLKARTKDLNVKMGIDDFIDAGGTWEELLNTKENPIEHKGLAYLFDRYAFCRGLPVGIIEIASGMFYRVEEWKHVEANCVETTLVQKGEKLVPMEINFPNMYMKHLERPEFTHWMFEPSLPPGLDQGAGTYNRWKGMAVEGLVGAGEAERYQEIVAMWKRFSAGVLGSGRDYCEKWIADLFQNPGRKTTQAMLVRSSLNGIGKTLIVEILRDIIGAKHSVRVTLADAVNHFNALMGDRVLVQIDEANDFAKQYDSVLKNLVSSEDAVVTLKGRDSTVVKNYGRLFITSNSVAPIALDEHNRRFFIMEPDLTIEDEKGDWAKWVGDVVAKELRSAEGLRMLRWYFDTIDISDWSPTAHVPRTDAMMDMVEASSSKNGELVTHLIREFEANPGDIWAIHNTLQATPEAKRVWSLFRDYIKNTKGQVVSHPMKVPGETGTKRVTIFVSAKRKPLDVRKVPDQGWGLVPGTVPTDDIVKGIRSAVRAYNEWSGVLYSSKI